MSRIKKEVQIVRDEIKQQEKQIRQLSEIIYLLVNEFGQDGNVELKSAFGVVPNFIGIGWNNVGDTLIITVYKETVYKEPKCE